MANRVQIYTDGACRGNPGPGGWGVVLLWKDREKTLKGGESRTTNNRMELTAAIVGLESLSRRCHVALTTDSRYVIDGINKWLPAWKRRDWKTVNRKPVRNIDLWQRLDAAAARHAVDWRWVKGHSGDAGNERADELANQAIDALLASG